MITLFYLLIPHMRHFSPSLFLPLPIYLSPSLPPSPSSLSPSPTLSPSLLPSLTWLRSRPVTRASADAVSADMSVDSLEEGDSIASSPLGALRATRGSVTSDELEFLPLSVQSNPAPSLPPLFRYLDSASNASLIALLERTLNRVSDLTVTRNLSCKEVCSEWRALGVFFAVDGRDLGGRRVANAHLALNLDRADFDALKEHQSSKFTN